MLIKTRLHLLGVLFAFFIFHHQVLGQSNSSTYSSIGIGEINNSGLTTNQAMGGMGISYGTAWSVNHVNPALSVKNNVFNFQAAFNYKRINANTGNQSADIDGGGLSYVAMSFPVQPRKWTIGLGLNQISKVDYAHLYENPVVNSDYNALSRIEGDGGISEVYLSTGFELFDNFNLGFQGSYVFGSTVRSQELTLLDEDGVPTGIGSEYYERLNLGDVSFKGGVHYALPLSKSSRLNFGGIYQSFGDISGSKFAKVANSGDADDPDSEGQLLYNDNSGQIYLPNKLGYGITYEKINKFAIGLEAQHQDFTKFKSFEGENDDLGQSFKIGLGGEFTPDIYSIESVFQRITYRAGVEFEQTPYLIGENKINDIGINFGASVPVNSLSLLNLAVKVGRRGNTEEGHIRENYLKVSMGFSINDNSWFYQKVFE
ncbi:hypothetical protein QWY93_06560 [Echinicola jeungdonensis]|uniref:Long-chain fatty acid transport protein n=1 Tax=Echinicola jeungdonensis TaxID=709343 RepID=A0ABV5J209_9BACT|nr:hypothetical protein [Echinicola jeungdonensis]MDN3668984.1 hypothetical protein [Echinicola jeungdonensis]